MKTVLTFEGQDIEAMSREELAKVVRYLAAENERLTRDALRLHREQAETFRRIARVTGHRVSEEIKPYRSDMPEAEKERMRELSAARLSRQTGDCA
ncbi:hypothetical protein VP03_12265 [Sinorhizobium meliloti]|uniref:hypothetical protein n=1 Tax=Rhizobium meliloti TaxID=382 RepID=UPI0006149654|nr:hypothetical protein [Sinorhizobium meliloti]KKA13709.1 hypothetical protein VP03_12265 [Sinorhizobium meliloti]